MKSTDAGPVGSARFRLQVAVICALADHIEHVAPREVADGRGEQLLEETARLGPDSSR